MVGCNHVIQDRQAVALFGYIEPLKPSSAVLGIFQEKFPFMTPMGDMPDVSRNIVSFRSRHGFALIILFLTAKTAI